MKDCVICGTEIPCLDDTPLCSKECLKEHRKAVIWEMDDDEAYCPTCGKRGFDSVQSMLCHHNQKHDVTLRTKECDECGEEFTNSHIKDRRFCSKECFSSYYHEGYVEKVCEGCGNDFRLRVSHDRLYKAKYCTQECYLSNNTGETNPHWKGGSDEIRRQPEYREWLKAIHDSRDDCAYCGCCIHLQAHHIVPISEDESRAFDEDNGILLCAYCHSDEHPDIPDRLFAEWDDVPVRYQVRVDVKKHAPEIDKLV